MLTRNAGSGASKKSPRLAGRGIKSTWPIFKAKILVYKSKAN